MEIVMCIDVGSSHTGYAFSSRQEFEARPLDIHQNEEWMSGHANLHTYKAPSCLLLKQDKTIQAFGYEAERRYLALLDNKQHDQFYYFRRFKADLKTKQFRKDTVIEEEGGKSINGIALFKEVFKYLRGHFMDTLDESARYGNMDAVVRTYNIRYVVTVPTKWDNASRDCMKSAAKKGGLTPCVLYSETEAAARYCRLIPLRVGEDTEFYFQTPASKQVIVDFGGCGVDTAVQEIGEDGSITEFPKILGATSGATRVDSDFQRFFFSLFGNDFADTYVKKHKLDFLELQYEFEMKKKRFTLESDLGASLELPHSLIKMYTAKYKQSIQFLIDDSDYVGKIVSNDEYLILNKNVMKDIFGPAVKSTVGYLTNLTRDPEVKQCDAIILVGGFVDSAVVSGAVRFYFPNSNMITVEEAELCVLRGGVLLGHSPDPDFSFQSKFSYGLGMAVPFNENTHPKKKRFIADEVQYCTDVFQPLIFSGKKYKIGELSRSVTLRLNRAHQKRLAVPIYVLRDKKVQFTTDEGCSPIGKLIVNLEDRKQGKAAVEIQMTLLGDSLVVMGTEEGSIDRTDAAFPLVWK